MVGVMLLRTSPRLDRTLVQTRMSGVIVSAIVDSIEQIAEKLGLSVGFRFQHFTITPSKTSIGAITGLS